MQTENKASTYSLLLFDNLVDCNRYQARLILNEAAELFGSKKVFNEIIPNALATLGEKWTTGEVALMQIYAASKIVEEAIGQISNDMKNHPSIGFKIIIGSLDTHGLGKNIISRFLKAEGIKVIDLGTEVSPENFVEAANKNGADALLVSALMLHTCQNAELIRELLDKQNLKIPMIVGGAPFNFDSSLWKRVGANATGRNVLEVVEQIKELLIK
jgi:methanogenic corrinoid protein MtbC1